MEYDRTYHNKQKVLWKNCKDVTESNDLHMAHNQFEIAVDCSTITDSSINYLSI
jgi:hypothetical protein